MILSRISINKIKWYQVLLSPPKQIQKVITNLRAPDQSRWHIKLTITMPMSEKKKTGGREIDSALTCYWQGHKMNNVVPIVCRFSRCFCFLCSLLHISLNLVYQLTPSSSNSLSIIDLITSIWSKYWFIIHYKLACESALNEIATYQLQSWCESCLCATSSKAFRIKPSLQVVIKIQWQLQE